MPPFVIRKLIAFPPSSELPSTNSNDRIDIRISRQNTPALCRVRIGIFAESENHATSDANSAYAGTSETRRGRRKPKFLRDLFQFSNQSESLNDSSAHSVLAGAAVGAAPAFSAMENN